MTKFLLTEDQKNMLRSIVPSLRSGDSKIETDWQVIYGDGQAVESIDGLNDEEIFRKYWEGVKESNFNRFENCGFIRTTKVGRHRVAIDYTLNPEAIVEAVDNEFEKPSISPNVVQIISSMSGGSVIGIQDNTEKRSPTPYLTVEQKEILQIFASPQVGSRISFLEGYPYVTRVTDMLNHNKNREDRYDFTRLLELVNQDPGAIEQFEHLGLLRIERGKGQFHVYLHKGTVQEIVNQNFS